MAENTINIAGASQDLQTIEDFVNLPAGSDVRPRLLPSVNVGTLAGTRDAIFEAGGLPATPFATKALMTASALADGDYAMVTNDAVNNGLYVKTAGAWVKSSYDPVEQAKSYADTSVAAESYKTWGAFDISAATGLKGYFTGSYINTLGAVRPSQVHQKLTASVFREIDTLAASIVINGHSLGDSVSLYAFYDATKTLISAVAGDGSGNVEVTIDEASIPANAKYIRYTGWDGVSNSITGVLPLAQTTTSTQAIVHDVIPKHLLDPLGEFAGDVTGYKNAYYIHHTSGDSRPSSNNFNLIASPFLIIDRSATTLEVKGYGSGQIALYALYDENKSKIETSIGSGIRIETLSLAVDSLPPNAFYIRYTGELGEGTYINGANPTPILDVLRDEFLPDNPTKKLNTLFITGASFAYSGNAWFGLANDKLGTTGINKARSGTGNPVNDAELFWRGTFITDAEFEAIDVFSFQYANVEELDSTVGLKASASEYTATFNLGETGNPFAVYSNAQNMDYILKLLQERCYAQKDNPNSKWFGTQHGKPFKLLFVTSWHDSRPYYNIPIRTLADRWGAGVCEFDRKIGFSKDKPLPNGKQVSTIYAEDNQVIEGITYGWHPKRGSSSEYIQNRMAEIYAASIKEWFL